MLIVNKGNVRVGRGKKVEGTLPCVPIRAGKLSTVVKTISPPVGALWVTFTNWNVMLVASGGLVNKTFSRSISDGARMRAS